MQDNTNNKTEASNPVGRPLKFKTVAELDQAIDAYFNECDPHVAKQMVEAGTSQSGETMFALQNVMTTQKPYTISGLAMSLGINRQTLTNYKDRPEFLGSIERALARCESYAESQLYEGNANGAKFVLTNNYAWKDKQEVEHSGNGGLFGTDALAIKVIDNGRDNPQS